MPEKTITEITNEYLELKKEADRIEELMEPVKGQIVAFLKGKGLNELVKEGFGKFALESKRKWTFPENCMKIKEELSVAEKEAKQLGTATSEDGEPYIKFYKEKESSLD